jgi:hypothetical protein
MSWQPKKQRVAGHHQELQKAGRVPLYRVSQGACLAHTFISDV